MAGDSEQSTYDAFISYSHSADDLLAPRLQTGLQRFAKPWWKRRAVRVFRDESSLAANPHLWSSITEALDTSGWFILLLSPDAASSEWVNREIDHWRANNDVSRILPVVTDGDFGWSGSDVAGSAVPAALRGAFAEEPRWVDMRDLRGDETLDLKNPTFSAAIADIAATIRGVPKDELASEEVRQHRRTIRTAWAAGIAVAGLGIAAGFFAVNAASEAAFARSQALAAASAAALEADPELATLLAVLSMQEAPGEPPVESIRALRRADAANTLETHIELTGFAAIDVTPDGRSIVAATTDPPLTVSLFDLATGSETWSKPLDDRISGITGLAVSPLGGIVVLAVATQDEVVAEMLVFDIADGDVIHTWEEPCNFIGWDLAARPFTPDGRTLSLGTGSEDCAVDPTASWVAFIDTESWEETHRLSFDDWPGESVSFAADGAHILVSDVFGVGVELLSYPSLEVLHDYTFNGSASNVALDPTGQRVAFLSGAGLPRIGIHDTAGELLGQAEGHGIFLSGPGNVFSSDGETLLVLARDGMVLVNAANGRMIRRLGPFEQAFDAAFTPDGGRVISSHAEGLFVWDVSEAAPLKSDIQTAAWANPDRQLDGPTSAVHVFTEPIFDGELSVFLVDAETGTVTDSVAAIGATQLRDGRFVIVEQGEPFRVLEGEYEGFLDAELHGLSVWDPQDGSIVPITICPVLTSEIPFYSDARDIQCDDGSPAYGLANPGMSRIVTSPDGRLVAAESATAPSSMCAEDNTLKTVSVWDVESLEQVAAINVNDCRVLAAIGSTWIALEGLFDLSTKIHDLHTGETIVELPWPGLAHTAQTADGRLVIGGGKAPGSPLIVYDTSDWTVVARWDVHTSILRGLTLSPDERRLVTTGEDGLVRIWDLAPVVDGTLAEGLQPPLLDEIPTGIASDARWISDDQLGVLLRTGAWITVDLDPAHVLEQVLSSLTRSFTPIECQTYRLDPCPTLADMRGD